MRGSEDPRDRLRHLAATAGGIAGHVPGVPGEVQGYGLDERTAALVRLAALVALRAAPVSYQGGVDLALAAGASAADMVDTLKTVARTVGLALRRLRCARSGACARLRHRPRARDARRPAGRRHPGTGSCCWRQVPSARHNRRSGERCGRSHRVNGKRRRRRRHSSGPPSASGDDSRQPLGRHALTTFPTAVTRKSWPRSASSTAKD